MLTSSFFPCTVNCYFKLEDMLTRGGGGGGVCILGENHLKPVGQWSKAPNIFVFFYGLILREQQDKVLLSSEYRDFSDYIFYEIFEKKNINLYSAKPGCSF